MSLDTALDIYGLVLYLFATTSLAFMNIIWTHRWCREMSHRGIHTHTWMFIRIGSSIGMVLVKVFILVCAINAGSAAFVDNGVSTQDLVLHAGIACVVVAMALCGVGWWATRSPIRIIEQEDIPSIAIAPVKSISTIIDPSIITLPSEAVVPLRALMLWLRQRHPTANVTDALVAAIDVANEHIKENENS